MRKTYRAHSGSKAYWAKRWGQIPADDGELNLQRYPGKYAEEVMRWTDGPVLEAGCGAGRVLIHYYRQGRPIVGMDFIETALTKIRSIEPEIPLCTADTMEMPFCDESFSAVLAFGLYHGLENGIEKALAETRRIIRPGGWLCVSLRADNIQNRVVDWMAERNAPKDAEVQFHKANYTRQEFVKLVEDAGFSVKAMEYVENMPFLYKIAAFRHRSHRRFDEHNARAEGYRLSPLGKILQGTLINLSPGSFCNINVAFAQAV